MQFLGNQSTNTVGGQNSNDSLLSMTKSPVVEGNRKKVQ